MLPQHIPELEIDVISPLRYSSEMLAYLQKLRVPRGETHIFLKVPQNVFCIQIKIQKRKKNVKNIMKKIS